VVVEPVACELGCQVQGAGPLEEMGSTGNDAEVRLAAHLRLCVAVELEHDRVVPTRRSGASAPGRSRAWCSEIGPRQVATAHRASER